MEPNAEFFSLLLDELQENHFLIRKLLYRTNGQTIIKAINKHRKTNFYRIDYNAKSLILTIKKRHFLLYRVISEVKINVENKNILKRTAQDIVKNLLH
jgi:hypothetical protein